MLLGKSFLAQQQPAGYAADCFAGFDGSAGCWLVVQCATSCSVSFNVTVIRYEK
jgi:hypothetical protein